MATMRKRRRLLRWRRYVARAGRHNVPESGHLRPSGLYRAFVAVEHQRERRRPDLYASQPFITDLPGWPWSAADDYFLPFIETITPVGGIL